MTNIEQREEQIIPGNQESFNEMAQVVSIMLGAEIIPPSSAHLSYDEFERRFPLRNRMFTSLMQLHNQGVSGSVDMFDIFPLPRRIKIMNKLDGYIKKHHEPGSRKVLRPRQIQALEMLHAQMESGRVNMSGYFDLPTRFGKTVVFSELIKLFDVETVVGVPTLITATQAEDELVERLDIEQLGRVFAGRHERGRQVTISSYDSMREDLKKKNIDPKRVRLLILDEAHLVLGGKRPEMLKEFSNALILGFSATTKYSEKKQLKNLIPPLIFGMTTREGAEEGLLSPFSSYEAKVEIDLNMSRVRITAEGDYNDSDIEKAVNNEVWNQGALEIYQRKEVNGRPTFIFCAGIDHAKDMAKLFKTKGIPTEVISGKNKVNEQKDILKRFRDGELRVLASADLLVTGVNEPKLSAVINARPTMSLVMAGQRGGRPLTLDPEDPEKHAVIVDMVARNSSGITYADVITEQAEGIINNPQIRQEKSIPGEDFVKRVEVRGLRVNVFTQEALTILENIKKAPELEENSEFNTSFRIDTIIRLLGSKADQIAERLPYYFRSENPGIVVGKLNDRINLLRSYTEGSESSLDLPVAVFNELIRDEIYQRVRRDAIAEEAPRIVRGINRVLTPNARQLPEIADQLSEFALVLESFKTCDISDFSGRKEAAAKFENLVKKFIYIKSEIELPSRNRSDIDAHHSINKARQMLAMYLENDARNVLKNRINKVMRNEPYNVLTFMNSHAQFQATEFYAEIADLVDSSEIRNTMENVEVLVLTDPLNPENILSFSQELRSVILQLKQKTGWTNGPLIDLEKDLVSFRNEMQAQKSFQYESASSSYYHFNEIVEKLSQFAALHGERMSQLKRQDKLEVEAIFARIEKGIFAFKNNKKILRSAIAQALVDNPTILGNKDDSYFRRTEKLRSEFLTNLRNNPNFAKVRLLASASDTLSPQMVDQLARDMASALKLN